MSSQSCKDKDPGEMWSSNSLCQPVVRRRLLPASSASSSRTTHRTLSGVGVERYACRRMVASAVIDGLLYLFVPRVTVCYRCRAEFREVPINPAHHGFELATAEKYRSNVQP